VHKEDFLKMAGFLKKKKVLIRAVVLFGAMVFAEACVFPSVNWSSLRDSSMIDYMAGVLEENRTGLTTEEEALLAEFILTRSAAYKLDPLLVMALIKTESTYYNRARSYKGAKGLMQIMPSTGRWVAGKLQLKWEGDRTLYNPYMNVMLGIHYFSTLMERFKDNTMLTLAAYNAGPSNLSALIRSGANLPKGYANKVLANYKELQERAGYN
jgi:soluble lytic murein transglycosylase-like protein